MEKTCVVCGRLFVGRKQKQTCSPACRKALSRRKLGEEPPQYVASEQDLSR